MNRELLQRTFDSALQKQKSGELCEAIVLYNELLALFPESHEIRINLGVALKDVGDIEGAIAILRAAISIKNDSSSAWSNLGIALRLVGRLDEAIVAMRKSVELNDRSALGWNNLGLAHQDAGRMTEAIRCLDRALAIDPNIPAVQSNRLYALHFWDECDEQRLHDEHIAWAARHAQFSQPDPFENERMPDRKLKIGYVSGDLREHAVGRFMLPLLANHDRSLVEIHCYNTRPGAVDAFGLGLREHADHWHDIAALSDIEAVQLIRKDRIDILVDLSLHMANNRMLLFARKPAPIQATYLAYCSTSGLNKIDYRITDAFLDPSEGNESIYSEQSIRLPETYWCYQPAAELDEPNPLPALANGYITFGCLNNFCKITPATLKVWCEILRQVPNSRLILHAHEGSHRQAARDVLTSQDIDPSRLAFEGFKPLKEYLELYRRIDIALDSFPYGGGTTSCDALWMGVPLLTLRGQMAVGRAGVSILSNLGLQEFIAADATQYVQIAKSLAGDLPRLTELRKSLRGRMQRSPLMNSRRFAQNMESVYRQMWQAWCLKSPLVMER
jgi:protein O-GlcNAc transferase